MGKLVFKIDVMDELKRKGYTTTKIRKEKLLSESTLTGIRKGIVPGAKLLTLCELLDRQPGSIIKYVPDKEEIE